MRKRIIIVVVIIVLIITALLGWFLLKDRMPAAPGSLGTLPGTSTTTVSNNHGEDDNVNKIRPESLAPITHFWISNKNVFLIDENGNILRDNKLLGNRVSGEVTRIRPDTNGRRVIVELRLSLTPQISIFDSVEKNWTPLQGGVKSADWHPQNNREVAYLLTGTNGGVYILNIENNHSRLVTPLSVSGVEIEWVDSETIMLIEKPDEASRLRVWALNILNKTVRKIIDAPGVIVGWIGNQGVVWNNGNLSLIDRDGATLGKFPVFTLPAKCAFDEHQENIYCGTNKDFNTLRFTFNYLKRVVKSADAIKKIILPRSARDVVHEGSFLDPLLGQFDVWHPEIRNDRFYFINRLDDKLYSFEI